MIQALFQWFHAVFKAHTKFKHFSSHGFNCKYFSICCTPCYCWYSIDLYIYMYIDRVLTATRQLWPLTQWGRNKIATVFQAAFSNAFSWMKIFVFWLKFHWRLFLRIQMTKDSTDSDNSLAMNRQQAITWTNVVIGYRRIYASLDLNKLISKQRKFPTKICTGTCSK